jgi:uncharacterized protein YwqG
VNDLQLSLLLDRLQRPSIYLRRSQLSPVGKSYFGGFPTLPMNLNWPRHLETDKPLHFLLQIQCSKLPKIAMSELLPPRGMLFFFAFVGDELVWDEPMLGERHAPTVVLFWPDEDVSLERMPPADMVQLYDEFAGDYYAPSEWEGDWRFGGEPGKTAFPRFRMDLVEAISFLPPPELPYLYKSCLEMLDQRLVEYLRTNGGVAWDHDEIPRHQILGAPWLLQSAALDHADKVLLLQIFSDRALEVIWGDVGIVQYWITKPDLQSGRFERAFATMECY